MKTVPIKADEEFDALLDRLARRLSTTRSHVSRDAVRNYQQHPDREVLRQQQKCIGVLFQVWTDKGACFDSRDQHGLNTILTAES